MAYVLQNRNSPPSVGRRICPLTSVASVVLASLLFVVYVCYVDNSVDNAPDYGQATKLHLTTRYTLEQMREFASKNAVINRHKTPLNAYHHYPFSKILKNPANRFHINASDVIVFIHIQKTAGTSFEKFLVKHLNISRPCVCHIGKKRCNCYRPHSKESWLFSRYSTGWACGLHADFTELFVSGCVEHTMDKREGKHHKRRYFYTTFLREPVERFVSEYSHVTRGANWLGARHVCNGQPPTPEELPMCFNPEIGWEGVALNEFLACPFNLAFNRQTRMLADLTLVNCYNRSSMNASDRDAIMLESAKNNLRNLAFFGIKERMNESQFIFESLFHVNFTDSLGVWNRSKSQHIQLNESQLALICEQNKLDIQLYRFAMSLFEKRLAIMRGSVGDDQSSSAAASYELSPPAEVITAGGNNNITPFLIISSMDDEIVKNVSSSSNNNSDVSRNVTTNHILGLKHL